MPAIDGSRILVAGGAHRVGRALALDLAEARRGRLRELPQLGRPGRADAGRDRGARPPLGRRAGRRRRPGSTWRRWSTPPPTRSAGSTSTSTARPAGSSRATPADVDEALWDAAIDSTAKGFMFAAQAAHRVMAAAGGGVIVAITDVAGLQPWPRFAPHGAAKAAQIHLVKCLAARLGPRRGPRVRRRAGTGADARGHCREPRRDRRSAGSATPADVAQARPVLHRGRLRDRPEHRRRRRPAAASVGVGTLDAMGAVMHETDEIRVLDHGFVRLDGCMADDLSVVNGARVSFAQRSDEMTDREAGPDPLPHARAARKPLRAQRVPLPHQAADLRDARMGPPPYRFIQ